MKPITLQVYTLPHTQPHLPGSLSHLLYMNMNRHRYFHMLTCIGTYFHMHKTAGTGSIQMNIDVRVTSRSERVVPFGKYFPGT